MADSPKPTDSPKLADSPKVADSPKTFEDVLDGLRNGKYKNIMICAGAGISTAAGIPGKRPKEIHRIVYFSKCCL